MSQHDELFLSFSYQHETLETRAKIDHVLPNVGQMLTEFQLLFTKSAETLQLVSGPNENSQKASISVSVLAADSQDGICVNEHQN